jgi:hypothetical protein
MPLLGAALAAHADPYTDTKANSYLTPSGPYVLGSAGGTSI